MGEGGGSAERSWGLGSGSLEEGPMTCQDFMSRCCNFLVARQSKICQSFVKHIRQWTRCCDESLRGSTVSFSAEPSDPLKKIRPTTQLPTHHSPTHPPTALLGGKLTVWSSAPVCPSTTRAPTPSLPLTPRARSPTRPARRPGPLHRLKHGHLHSRESYAARGREEAALAELAAETESVQFHLDFPN